MAEQNAKQTLPGQEVPPEVLEKMSPEARQIYEESRDTPDLDKLRREAFAKEAGAIESPDESKAKQDAGKPAEKTTGAVTSAPPPPGGAPWANK